MVTLDILSSVRGENRLFLEDVTAEKRAELGTQIEILLRQGYQIFLLGENNETAHRIAGYDAQLNEWIVYLNITESRPKAIADAAPARPEQRRRRTARVQAHGSRSIGIALSAGG